jgi:regulatory protein YycI of two-component signal transduction system YycFG
MNGVGAFFFVVVAVGVFSVFMVTFIILRFFFVWVLFSVAESHTYADSKEKKSEEWYRRG